MFTKYIKKYPNFKRPGISVSLPEKVDALSQGAIRYTP